MRFYVDFVYTHISHVSDKVNATDDGGLKGVFVT